MHICFFNRSYWPDTAATGQLLTELAEDLVARFGCRVSVVCGVSAGDPRSGRSRGVRCRLAPVRRERHNGVEIFRAAGTTKPTERFAGRASNYLTYFASACAAALIVPAADVVVALTDPPIVGLAGLALARRSRAKFVFLCEDVFPEVASLLEDFRNDAVNRTLERLSRFIVAKADRVVALGERMRERLVADRAADREKISVIHNWADCSAIVPGERRNRFSQLHGLADKFVVMHSGNVGMSQNLETLVQAADRLGAYADIVIVIVGHGARIGAIHDMVRARRLANVRFLPQQPKEQLAEVFASADVFVVGLKKGIEGYIVPSKTYGILAAGRPSIVAVDASSEPAAIVREHDCGLIVDPGDADILAERILMLYHDRARLARMAANARRAALEFDRPRQVAAYYQVFSQLAAPA
jgi:glycosyltransferase involved in cell wall biosynthesis